MPTRRLAALAALLLLGLALAPPTADAATKDRCRLKGSTLLAKQGSVRVLQKGRDWYACYRKRKPFFLFDGATNERAIGLVIGVRHVAYVDRRIAPVDGIPDVSLQVVDVRSKARNSTPVDESVGAGSAAVPLVMTPAGIAALRDARRLIVLSPAPGSAPVAVAYGDAISQVAAGPDTIYWQSGGSLFSTVATSPTAAPAP